MGRETYYRKISPRDFALRKVQDYAVDATRVVRSSEIAQGTLVTHEFPAATLTQNVPTRLRRRVTGWIVVRSIPPAAGAMPTLVEDTTLLGTTGQPDPDVFVRFTASAATTATIWFF